jgi:ADP-heptose:LPS heptosyltransferase
MFTVIKTLCVRVRRWTITNNYLRPVKKKVLLIRLDKIGDLICTLPADQILDSKAYDITWVVQRGLGQLLDLAENKIQYLEIDKSNPESAKKIFSDFLKTEKFDIAISFQCPWWINFELFKHRIKKRIGVLSQWHSFLFLNHALRQKRSQAVKHEFEYNLDLVKKITGPVQIDSKNLVLKFQKPISSATLEKFNLKNYIVIHPGMMGSALNWSQDQYIAEIQNQIDHNKTVVITGTASDEPYLTKIKSMFENHPQICWLQSKLSMRELIEILYFSEKIIAPSTGVVHVAASLGKNISAIYSPILVHHPKRWGPRPISLSQDIEIALPHVPCPAPRSCFLDQCPYFNCMDRVKLKTSV